MKFGLLVASVAAIGSISITTPARASADPFIGEIMMVGYTFCPRGWAEANGQLLAISQNTALFSLYGTTYGGDGRTTFALPDLRGRAPVVARRGVMHASSGFSLPNMPLCRAHVPALRQGARAHTESTGAVVCPAAWIHQRSAMTWHHQLHCLEIG